eukprot:1943111-Pleurochrysis_carterae.AAC.4
MRMMKLGLQVSKIWHLPDHVLSNLWTQGSGPWPFLASHLTGHQNITCWLLPPHQGEIHIPFVNYLYAQQLSACGVGEASFSN